MFVCLFVYLLFFCSWKKEIYQKILGGRRRCCIACAQDAHNIVVVSGIDEIINNRKAGSLSLLLHKKHNFSKQALYSILLSH